MLTLRPPTPYDLPPLYTLAMDHATKYLDDYSAFDLDQAKIILASPGTVIIDDHGYAAGVAFFADTRDDLHSHIHMLIRPEYWRRAFKQDIFSDILNWGFESLGVAKILAEPLSSQKGAIKLLRKYKFYEHRPFYKHSKQAGVIVDVIMFELRKNYWRQQNELRKK